ncbi:hypothetical protein K438DRAFT_1939536 [Mycena galopus ATCC 62051]|nr:hypothetical protein K438DRAFT_1939536 [Mycena galopus ATCC 62051]
MVLKVLLMFNLGALALVWATPASQTPMVCHGFNTSAINAAAKSFDAHRQVKYNIFNEAVSSGTAQLRAFSEDRPVYLPLDPEPAPGLYGEWIMWPSGEYQHAIGNMGLQASAYNSKGRILTGNQADNFMIEQVTLHAYTIRASDGNVWTLNLPQGKRNATVALKPRVGGNGHPSQFWRFVPVA